MKSSSNLFLLFGTCQKKRRKMLQAVRKNKKYGHLEFCSVSGPKVLLNNRRHVVSHSCLRITHTSRPGYGRPPTHAYTCSQAAWPHGSCFSS